MLGNVSCFYCPLLNVFKINLFKTFFLLSFADIITIANSFDPDQGRQNVGPDLLPKHLMVKVECNLEKKIQQKLTNCVIH